MHYVFFFLTIVSFFFAAHHNWKARLSSDDKDLAGVIYNLFWLTVFTYGVARSAVAAIGAM